MKAHGTHDPATLTAAQMRAVKALVEGKSLTATAQAAGVNAATLYRWRRDAPAFVAEVRASRALVFGEATESLRRAFGQATDVLVGLLSWKGTAKEVAGATIRLRAAEAVIAGALRAHDVLETDAAILEIEERLRDDKGGLDDDGE